jgi:exopolysaccharide production protein ExoQ
MNSNVSGPVRAAVSARQSQPRRAARPSIRKVADRGTTIVLAILFWLIFYQNLPGNLGLNALPGTRWEGIAGFGNANWADRVTRVAMLGICFSIVAVRWPLARSLLKTVNPGLAAIMVLIPLSAVWSIDSSATMLRFTSLATMVLVCFSVALITWTRQRFQQLVIPPIMYILVVSLVVGMIYPDRIIELGNDISQKSAWHGITHFKNQFGMTASVGIILCFHHWLSGGRRTYWAIAGIAAGFACLWFSRSNTSQLATFICVIFMALVMRVPVIKYRYTTHVVVGLAATLLLYELVIQDVIPGVHFLLSPIASLTGKDTTFSSRTEIWQLIKDHIHAAPLLGTGYAAYWVGPYATSPSYIFTYLLFFYPSEAHNGYLDIVNDLGLVGLTCLLAFIYWYLRQGLQLMRIDRAQAALYLALLFQQMVMNMSESEWFSRSSTSVVVLLAAICMARDLIEHRRQVPTKRAARGPSR